MIDTLCSVFVVSGNLDYFYYKAKNSIDSVPDESRSRLNDPNRIRLPDATDDISSSETQGQSVGSGGKAGRMFSSKDGIAPGYRLSPDHFQKFKRMLALDWAQKMLCINVPNRRTYLPSSFRVFVHDG